MMITPHHVGNGNYDIIAIAASAGGIIALPHVLSPLPPNFPVALVIVQHLDPQRRSLVTQILARSTSLLVKEAEQGETLQPATIYIAPPDRHLIITKERTVSLTQTQLVHYVRPSADLLFESVALCYEELQSTVEELETTNEELQSTNEELEAVNEEMNSSNEEMQTVNEELQQRTHELDHANAFLESILTGLRAGVVVVDHKLSILTWNHRAEDLWGLRKEEVVGQFFLNLDIGLPVQQLKEILRLLLDGEDDHYEITLDAINRRGKTFRCRITGTPLYAEKKRQGVILFMVEQQQQTEQFVAPSDTQTLSTITERKE